MRKLVLILLGMGFLFCYASEKGKNVPSSNQQIVIDYNLQFKEDVMRDVKIKSLHPFVIESNLFEVVIMYNNDTGDIGYGVVQKYAVISNTSDFYYSAPVITTRSGDRDGYYFYTKGDRTCGIYGTYGSDGSFTAASKATQVLMNFCFDGILAFS